LDKSTGAAIEFLRPDADLNDVVALEALKMSRVKLAFRLIVVALPLVLPAAARAGDDDAMDLAFWQSIQNSTNPAEYQTYLDAFPNGKFAKLASIRAHPVATTVAIPLPPLVPPKTAPGAPGAQTTIDDTDDTDDTPAGKIVLFPTAPRVGQTIRITCEDFPQPTSYDEIIVVPAGTPVMDPARAADQTKVLYFAYAVNCYHLPLTAGPFAPGAYEVRFMTRLYSNAGVSELHATTGFRVH
jgi:hypothetical protein